MTEQPSNLDAKPISLLLFSSARTALPSAPHSLSVPLPTGPITLEDFRDHLQTEPWYTPEFGVALKKSAFSVDEEMVRLDEEHQVSITGGETIAIIPPVSGG